MKIALLPIYNEEGTVLSVLESVIQWADHIVLINDGSRDNSDSLIRAWMGSHPTSATYLALDKNRGMSAALKLGFQHIEQQLIQGRWNPEDLVILMDADGQYQGANILELCKVLEKHHYDVLTVQRDFSSYPMYKRWGNKVLSLWAGFLCGQKYNDIEAGLRVMRAKVIPSLLRYFLGWRYSCAQEIGIITVLLGFRVDNTFRQPVHHYRSRTQLLDVLINASMGLLASLRIRLKELTSTQQKR
ncbi:MAG: glycosyltransferase family 2 protein [Elusimicrobia bacterium]|nr:glycosyltransferase family 2 protein [Elusimicrobiota bacterium]